MRRAGTAGRRYLIVNADDFGQSVGVNRGIVTAHRCGLVTSASLMVRWPAAAEAAAYGRAHPDLSLGLHVDLRQRAYRDGRSVTLYQVVPLADGAVVAGEVSRQLAAFRRLVGRDPTHIDAHQHAHRNGVVGRVLAGIARQLAVPLRECTPDVRFCGRFYGKTATGVPNPGAISVDHLIEILAGLPPGITELMCHPGEGDDLDAMYRGERSEEVKVLCDPRVRAAVAAEGIELRSFHDVAGFGWSPSRYEIWKREKSRVFGLTGLMELLRPARRR
jgi:chitin disaccharide deacetylase